MITLDDILKESCDVIGVEMNDVCSKNRINERHQNARVVFCHVASGRFTYTEIGSKINRKKQHVCRNMQITGSQYEQAVKEVVLNLKSKQE